METKEKPTAQKSWGITDILVAGLQIGASAVFAYLIKAVLPFKYWIIAAAALGLLAVWVCGSISSLSLKIKRY